MKVLILSCDTGEGHNSAGRAVKEFVEKQGDQAVMLDMMLLKGKRVSRGGQPDLYQCGKGCSRSVWLCL